jgi:hypothetical protein
MPEAATSRERFQALTFVLALALALLVHPWLRLSDRFPEGRLMLAVLALALVASLVLSSRTLAESLVAGGAVLVLFGLGYDAARGHRGSLALAPGQASHLFEEEGPVGASLGLRPLGFEVRLEGMEDGVLSLGAPGETGRVGPDRGWSHGGFRFAQPATGPTGEASRLRLAVTMGGDSRDVDLLPGETTRVGDLEIALERYFADFALDGKGEPYSRSPNPRNPAALLRVQSPKGRFRVFVIRALPGIHQQPGLSASFSLQAVDPQLAVQLAVVREPLALLCLAGVLLGALGIGLGLLHP